MSKIGFLQSLPRSVLVFSGMKRLSQRIWIAAVFLAAAPSCVYCQALPPAMMHSPFEIAAGYTQGRSDYTANTLKGVSVIVDHSLLTHIASETSVRRLTDTLDPTRTVSEISATTGVKYTRAFGIVAPSLKLGAGVGFLTTNVNNVSFTAYAPAWTGGAGLEVRVTKAVSLRADFDYQRWMPVRNFDQGLSAHLVTVGLVYRLASRVDRGQVY